MAIDMKAILRDFNNNTEEHLKSMEEKLVALESTPEKPELLNDLFRAAHRIKGDANMLDLDALTEFAHSFETLLEMVRSKKVPQTPNLIGVMYRSLDTMRDLLALALGKKEGAVAGGNSKKEAAAQEEVKSIHVRIDKLDRVLNLTGEIAISREKLRQRLDEKGRWSLTQLQETHMESEQLYRDLYETVTKSRLVPLGPLFHQYTRTVRDLSESLGKRVSFRMEGEDVEVDTAIAENLRDPLTHMIRNAIDHGIERSEERQKMGKDAVGRLLLRAVHAGGSVTVEIVDDGRGLDRNAIATQVKAKGLFASPESLSDAELFNYIFEAGFSTAKSVTSLSGRGVGLDIVRKNIESLRGTVNVSSRVGQGTTVSLRLPLTLAIIRGFVVGAGNDTYILPLESVVECVGFPEEEQIKKQIFGFMEREEKPLPYAHLERYFNNGVRGGKGRESVVIVQSEGKQAGLVVSALHGRSQVVIKPLPDDYQYLEGLSGSAIMGNGRVALILDTPNLIKKILRDAKSTVTA
jgi:two-component system chemotaxis sensor kinase CheA